MAKIVTGTITLSTFTSSRKINLCLFLCKHSRAGRYAIAFVPRADMSEDGTYEA